MTEYLVIYEQTGDGGWSAYSPDVPGVIAAGATREEVERLMQEAIPFHLDALREADQPIPGAVTRAGYVAA